MKSPKTGFPPLDSREYLSFLRCKFHDAYVIKTFRPEPSPENGDEEKNLPPAARTLNRWTANPNWATGEGSVRRNPVERFEATLRACMERGHAIEARSMVASLAHLVGCELVVTDEVEPDHQTIADECLDDIPALARFHEMIRDPRSSVEEVRAKWREAKQELDEDYALYVRKREDQLTKKGDRYV